MAAALTTLEELLFTLLLALFEDISAFRFLFLLILALIICERPFPLVVLLEAISEVCAADIRAPLPLLNTEL